MKKSLDPKDVAALLIEITSKSYENKNRYDMTLKLMLSRVSDASAIAGGNPSLDGLKKIESLREEARDQLDIIFDILLEHVGLRQKAIDFERELREDLNKK